MARRLIVSPVTRIEGHARIIVDLDDAGKVVKGHLQVWEIRGFEKLLEHTELFKMPQVTARLCGVCPAAHHLASVTAIENGLGLTIPTEAERLRELLYAGHVLHSHALSNFVLVGPDVLQGIGADPASRNVFSLLKMDPEQSRKFLRLRSVGQRTVEIVGGRGVHPVTAVPGGMAKGLNAEERELISGFGREATALLEELVPAFLGKLGALDDLRDAMKLPFPALALSDGGKLDFRRGDWVVLGPDGREQRRFESPAYREHLMERTVEGSYMKRVHLRGDPEQTFFVGPLARLLVNRRISTPKADAALQAFRSAGPRQSAVDYLHARLVEMIHAAERMAEIPGQLDGGPVRVPASPREGRFVGAIEAPRGILVHDYEADSLGRVTAINFIVATQNNCDAIDRSITDVARHLVPGGEVERTLNGLEFALRCFDPCLACATHAAGRLPLEVEIRSADGSRRTLARR